MTEHTPWIHVNLAAQRLRLYGSDGAVLADWPVATGANGAGELDGSGCTPRGRHIVRARIGAGEPADAVFVGRRPTGERYTRALADAHPGRDWILGRILWLSGTEPGHNRLGRCDTMRRFIYIHGGPPESPLGQPVSHGCIRMHPDAVVELFDRVPAGTPVVIE
ncbi:L,D-transpeptidase [Arhodomonas aquaeolei]|uniref:L,D-transpeptidase n=2 Tax=Ectothiorhodospiraceae TaxID=72276 RepID=UPI0003829CFA|nr:L,D-transpeptidase [Arhodomonas aquaeolei]MCS4503289.1 L,D-transpeptidase [Arhodomonas aquaeolei]